MNKTVKISLIVAGTLIAVALPGISFCPRIARWMTARSLDGEVRYSLSSLRGDIYDANGDIIATSERVYDIHLDCTLIQNDTVWKEKTLALAPRLASLLPERGAAQWWDYLQDGRNNHNRYLKIAKGLAPELKDSVAQLPIFNMRQFEGGAIFTSSDARRYPYDSLARRCIGYIHPEGPWKVGLEGKYDVSLHGTDGYRIIRYSRSSGKRRQKETERKEPVNGADIHTTLSMPVQSVADSALRAVLNREGDLESGCLILMEVHTGAIRAMVNLSKGERRYSSGKAWERYNCSVASLYEPGEVLQTMTLASVLRDGSIRSLEERIDDVSLKEGLASSYRNVFGKLATKHYAGSEEYFIEGIRTWCLPRSFDFDVEGFRLVDITNPNGLYWTDRTLPSVANGHALVMVPLDILSFYNTIANLGTMVQPYLVETVQSGEGTTYRHGTLVLKEHAMSPANADTLARALRFVTAGGTGRRLRDAKVPIAGKTGTARQILNPYDEHGLADDPYHDNEGRQKIAATYAGFFPADAPQYSVICVLYSYPTWKTFFGGTYPALVVKDLAETIVNGNASAL